MAVIRITEIRVRQTQMCYEISELPTVRRGTDECGSSLTYLRT